MGNSHNSKSICCLPPLVSSTDRKVDHHRGQFKNVQIAKAIQGHNFQDGNGADKMKEHPDDKHQKQRSSTKAKEPFPKKMQITVGPLCCDHMENC